MKGNLAREPVAVLIVEDNRGDVLLVREALKDSAVDFKLTHIADGEQACDYLRVGEERNDTDPPRLILLDLNLPKRDGWEILSEIRATPGLRDTPVVILSSSGDPSDRERAARTPPCLYIRKPSTLDEFLAIGKQIEDFWHVAGHISSC